MGSPVDHGKQCPIRVRVRVRVRVKIRVKVTVKVKVRVKVRVRVGLGLALFFDHGKQCLQQPRHSLNRELFLPEQG